jgi:membrane protein DedA with SNARE-associated domain
MLTQLMNLVITWITSLYVATGLIGVFLIMALESCYVPLPASEIIIPIAGALVIRGHLLSGLPLWMGLTLVSLASSFGCLIGSMIAYIIGYSGGRPLLLKYGRYVLISRRDLERADKFFQHWGSAATFYSRLLPVVRTWASLPAGVTKMPFLKFCIYTWFGSLLWCIVLTNLGALLGNKIDQLKPISGGLSTFILAVCVILVVLYIWSRIRDHERDRDTTNSQ